MFEYFSSKSIKAIVLAQEEARRHQQSLVGTEYLLLGLVEEGTSAVATRLLEWGLNAELVRQAIDALIGRVPKEKSTDLPFSTRAKQVLREALALSRELNAGSVQPEHVLLALIDRPDSVAASILAQNDVDLTDLRSDIVTDLKRQPVAVGSDAASTAANASEAQRDLRSKSRKSVLADFGTDLTQKAREGKLDPMVGRSLELERTLQILGRRTKNNPVLIGEPGVGKTAIVEGLAQRIVEGDVPESLQNKRAIALDTSLLVAGTAMRGDFEQRISAIIEEVRSAGDIILFIDEIHTLVGAGATNGAMDAANLLKPALARGELQCIGATTLDEYRKYIEKDAALERRFQPVKVGEPSVTEAIAILGGLGKTYEEFHQVKFSDAAIEAAVKLSDRYISDRFLPDKAIDLIDEAGSRRHIRHTLQNRQAEEAAIFNPPAIDPQCLVPVVEADDIAEIVAAWTGIPVNRMLETEAESLLNLEARLQERVIGQNAAVQAVARATRRARSGLKDARRPIASFLFAGPTGVGKTELAKTLATFLFGSPDAMVRLDMSEYMESHTVSKLIGSPPGFIGHDEGGQLTEAVRRKPYAVLLFDEIEKAHPDVFNLFLQLLDEGFLTDSKGRKVNFSNTLIILTSNLGSKVIEKGGSGLGFDAGESARASQYQHIQRLVTDELKQFFRPEFLNRLDEVVVFHPLASEELAQIADISIADAASLLRSQRQIELTVTEAFRDRVIVEGYEPRYGARPLRRALTRLLEDSLAEAILSGRVKDGDRVCLDWNGDRAIVNTAAVPEYAIEGVRV